MAVGYVQGGDALEMTSLDPVRGVYMYTLDTQKAAKVEFGRRADCLRCHQGPPTLAVPGLMVSFRCIRERMPGKVTEAPSITDGRVPIEERWGGWYVSGTSGEQMHYGNNQALVADPLPFGRGRAQREPRRTSRIWLNVVRYLPVIWRQRATSLP